MALDISNSDSDVEIIWHTEMDENKSKAGSNESTLKGAAKLESDSKDDEMVPISEKNLKMEDNVANKTLPEDQNIIKEEVVAEEEIDSSLPIKEKKGIRKEHACAVMAVSLWLCVVGVIIAGAVYFNTNFRPKQAMDTVSIKAELERLLKPICQVVKLVDCREEKVTIGFAVTLFFYESWKQGVPLEGYFQLGSHRDWIPATYKDFIYTWEGHIKLDTTADKEFHLWYNHHNAKGELLQTYEVTCEIPENINREITIMNISRQKKGLILGVAVVVLSLLSAWVGVTFDRLRRRE